MAEAFDKQLQDLLDDNRSGSREITTRAAALFKSLVAGDEPQRGSLINQLRFAARRLEKAHVSLAAVRSFCDAVLLVLDSAPPREELVNQLDALFSDWDAIYTDRLTLQLASLLSPMVKEARLIVSHSRSQTVLEVLKCLQPRQTKLKIVQSVSWPVREGINMARDLAAAGYSVELIADGGLASAMASADLALTGADRVGPDGVVNKQGTLALAFAAKFYGKPMVALADMAKFRAAGQNEIFPCDPAELLPEAIAGVTADNRYFEVIPLELYTAVITEKGAFDAAIIRVMFSSPSTVTDEEQK